MQRGSMPPSSCCDFTLAHLARCAAAIFLRIATEMVRLGPLDGPLSFAHRALCARAIFRREAADIVRFGWFVLL